MLLTSQEIIRDFKKNLIQKCTQKGEKNLDKFWNKKSVLPIQQSNTQISQLNPKPETGSVVLRKIGKELHYKTSK